MKDDQQINRFILSKAEKYMCVCVWKGFELMYILEYLMC